LVRKAVAVVVRVADKAAVVEAEASPAAAVAVNPEVVAAARAVVARAAAVVVDVRPEAVAALAVNSSHSSGASQSCGAPFFY
jgi:hypothetical protein